MDFVFITEFLKNNMFDDIANNLMRFYLKLAFYCVYIYIYIYEFQEYFECSLIWDQTSFTFVCYLYSKYKHVKDIR